MYACEIVRWEKCDKVRACQRKLIHKELDRGGGGNDVRRMHATEKLAVSHSQQSLARTFQPLGNLQICSPDT